MRARFNCHRGHRVHREIPPYVTDEAAIASDGLLQIEKDCLCVLGDLCGRRLGAFHPRSNPAITATVASALSERPGDHCHGRGSGAAVDQSVAQTLTDPDPEPVQHTGATA